MALKMALVTWCVLMYVALAAARGQMGQQESGSLTCSERVKQARLRDQGLVADKEYPSCDDGGNYKAKQCYGKWTRHGHCSCVNPMTGDKIEDVRGTSYRSLQGAAMTCRCALDYSDSADRAKYCDSETGDYKAVVCFGGKCHCAERWGAPMNHLEMFNKGDSTCLCARRLADVSGLVGTSYSCDTYGRFNPVQCMGSQCYCVDDDGIQVGLSVFISKAADLKC